MNYFSATIYGIIQGISEFLPISSSGHLALLPKFTNWKDPGVAFDLAMHLGTAFAVIVYFRLEIKNLLYDGFSAIITRENKTKTMRFYNLAISTIASVICILLLKDFALNLGRSKILISINLSVFGIIMYIADRSKSLSDQTHNFETLKIKDSVFMGIFQSLAIFPGVSRSGITLTFGRYKKYTRKESAAFSFLLSLPIILAAFIHEIPHLSDSPNFSLGICLYGVFVSFIIGLITIHYFLKVISKLGLAYFSLYRVLIAIVIMIFV